MKCLKTIFLLNPACKSADTATKLFGDHRQIVLHGESHFGHKIFKNKNTFVEYRKWQ
jgi:hypothetical protein